MSNLLFDTPWWLPAVIAAVGVVLFLLCLHGSNQWRRGMSE